MIKVGDFLPEFKGLNQNGELIFSKDFIGKKLVVFFYPQASTPTCTVEACNIATHYTKLKSNGYEVLGISTDSVTKQKKFYDKNSLPYTLIADESKEIVEMFGVWKEKKNFGKIYMGTVRKTFLFDEKGICIRVIDKVKSKEASEQILSKS